MKIALQPPEINILTSYISLYDSRTTKSINLYHKRVTSIHRVSTVIEPVSVQERKTLILLLRYEGDADLYVALMAARVSYNDVNAAPNKPGSKCHDATYRFSILPPPQEQNNGCVVWAPGSRGPHSRRTRWKILRNWNSQTKTTSGENSTEFNSSDWLAFSRNFIKLISSCVDSDKNGRTLWVDLLDRFFEKNMAFAIDLLYHANFVLPRFWWKLSYAPPKLARFRKQYSDSEH